MSSYLQDNTAEASSPCVELLDNLLEPYFDIDKLKNGKYRIREGMGDPVLIADVLLSSMEEEVSMETWALDYDKFQWLEGLCVYLCRTMRAREEKNARIIGGIRGQILGTADSQLIIRDKTHKEEHHFTKNYLTEYVQGRIIEGMNLCHRFKDFFENLHSLRQDLNLTPETFGKIYADMAADVTTLHPNIGGSPYEI